MRSNKIYQFLPFGIVFILLLTFSDIVLAQKKKRQSLRPVISVAKIYKDIVGKSVESVPSETTGSDFIGWEFGENEPREIEVLKNEFLGDEAYINIKMFTQGAISNDGLTGRLRGNLRLHYERIAGGWLLTEVENLTFKYVVSNSSGNITSQRENPVSVPSDTSIVSGAFTISAGRSKSWRFVVSNRATVSGRFRVSEGRYDVEVFILDEDGYENFKNGHTTSTFFNSGRRTVGTVNATLGSGVYYIVFNNGYSILTPKAIEANISIQSE